jgi:hypothetical protein
MERVAARHGGRTSSRITGAGDECSEIRLPASAKASWVNRVGVAPGGVGLCRTPCGNCRFCPRRPVRSESSILSRTKTALLAAGLRLRRAVVHFSKAAFDEQGKGVDGGLGVVADGL